MKIPKAIQSTIESFERLPGIGPKSAQRLTFYLLHVPQHELDRFAQSVQDLKRNTVLCSVCFSVGEEDPCAICSSSSRDQSTLCVVEQALDVIALEKSGRYSGVYHVLNGHTIKEIILATNPTMEGEATAMYIAKELKTQNSNLKITRIGRGLPIGADLEYADSMTLQRAMEGRSSY